MGDMREGPRPPPRPNRRPAKRAEEPFMGIQQWKFEEAERHLEDVAKPFARGRSRARGTRLELTERGRSQPSHPREVELCPSPKVTGQAETGWDEGTLTHALTTTKPGCSTKLP
jgi:hypothetical protein